LLACFRSKVGILTKTDLVKAYNDGRKMDDPVQDVMSMHLATCDENMNRYQVAKILEQNKSHHAIVMDPKTRHFKGLLSSFDIAVECAKDDRAVSKVIVCISSSRERVLE
jgi:predicted transcriptional regulator